MAGIAPAPRPCSARPSTSTSIDGARPPTTSPMAKTTSPAANGTAGRMRSAAVPATTMPMRLPRKKALNTQP